MKKFLVNIVFFSIGLIVINLVFLRIVDRLYYNEYETVNLDYKVYLLSDSHGIPLSNYLEKYGAYNFSARSDSYSDMYRKVKFLLNNTNVESIIISADDHTLSKYREKSNNLDRSSFYADLSCFDTVTDFIKEKYIKRNIIIMNAKGRDVIKLYFKSVLKRILKKVKRVKTKSINTKWQKLSPNEQMEFSIKRARTQFPDGNRSAILTTSLEDIISLCIDSNVEIIGIKFPISNQYNNVLKELRYLKSDINDIFLKNNIKIYDLSEIFTNNDEFFSNQDHLNSRGGEEFVKVILKNKLLRLPTDSNL